MKVLGLLSPDQIKPQFLSVLSKWDRKQLKNDHDGNRHFPTTSDTKIQWSLVHVNGESSAFAGVLDFD